MVVGVGVAIVLPGLLEMTDEGVLGCVGCASTSALGAVAQLCFDASSRSSRVNL